jgi:ribonuclease HI
MKESEARLQDLCGAVLSGRYDDARTLALRYSTPKPKGSSILRAWFDGSCWPNPGGHAGYGVVVQRHNQTIYSKAVYLGNGPHLTHEIAEYAGVVAVLRFLLQEQIPWATVYGDSQMVIKQLNGTIKARRGAYLSYYQEAHELMARLPNVRLVWISRGQNTEADRLSKTAVAPFISCGLLG